MRRFAKIELGVDKVPDESTILNFRHMLEEHDLTRAMFDCINGLMESKGLLLRSGNDRGRHDHRSAEFNQERDR